MKIDGLNEFKDLIATIKRDFPTETQTFVQQQAEEVKANTKLNTPVDTGTLRNGWQRMKGGDYKQIIYNNVTYSIDVEYGHMNRGGGSYYVGRYMLTKAIKKQESKFYKDLHYVFGKVVDK